MFGLSGLRLGGAVVAALALAFLMWAAQDRFRIAGELKEIRGDVAACSKAAEKQTASADTCGEPIKAAIAASRAAKHCDVALSAANRSATSFGIQAACSTAVKTEVAGRTAAEAGQRAAEAEVDKLIADQAKIADRAEARGRSQAARKDAADAAINTAPPGTGAGTGKRCDAGCLRRLTGKA